MAAITTSQNNSTEDRALALLGTGLSPEVVANALGVSASRISQLLSTEDFAAKVTTLRFENLQKHNLRDTSYDTLEDDLLDKMQTLLPLMMRPMEVLKALSVVNAAKRRGQATPDAGTVHQTIVQLVMPTQVMQSFQLDAKNSVIQTGSQELRTMNPKDLLAAVQNKTARAQLPPVTGEFQYEQLSKRELLEAATNL